MLLHERDGDAVARGLDGVGIAKPDAHRAEEVEKARRAVGGKLVHRGLRHVPAKSVWQTAVYQ